MSLKARGALTGAPHARGWTLVELLAVLLAMGTLAALAVPLYLGYVRDARLAEAKAMAGSVLAALQACAETKGEHDSCGLAEISERIGVSSSGLSPDSRWHVRMARLTLISKAPAAFSGLIAVAGRANKDTADTAMAIFQSAAGIVVRCNTRSSAPPVSPSDGEAC